MNVRKTLFLTFFCLFAHHLSSQSLTEKFKEDGFVEICDNQHGTETFDSLYAYFDDLIEFLQTNPVWAQKLYSAKERFIRTKDKNYYSTDFFGFYDESKKEGRNQISFYHSTLFHRFIFSQYPEFKKIPKIIQFFNACQEIQDSYGNLFIDTAKELGLESIFSSEISTAILFKVIKYLPSYFATTPHYDGSAFSVFVDSTDNQSLLLSPYKSSYCVDDFSFAQRQFPRCKNQNSMLLIPGVLLTEFSIFPTPHIVAKSGKARYATIAFAMRSHFNSQRNEYSPLPKFNIE